MLSLNCCSCRDTWKNKIIGCDLEKIRNVTTKRKKKEREKMAEVVRQNNTSTNDIFLLHNLSSSGRSHVNCYVSRREILNVIGCYVFNLCRRSDITWVQMYSYRTTTFSQSCVLNLEYCRRNWAGVALFDLESGSKSFVWSSGACLILYSAASFAHWCNVASPSLMFRWASWFSFITTHLYS